MVNKRDLRILVELRINARAQLTNISKKTGIPISTIYDRIKNRGNDLINRHVSLINYDILGFNTRAQLCLKSNKNTKRELFEHLSKHPCVNSLCKINNGYDYMAEVVFKNVKELEEFIESLDEKNQVKNKQIYYIIDDFFREKFFSKPEHIDLIKIHSKNDKN
jgi:DNA-binding Lrp family transcriptional regulator